MINLFIFTWQRKMMFNRNAICTSADAYVLSTNYNVQIINVSDLKPGMYLVQFLDIIGNSITKKIIKE